MIRMNQNEAVERLIREQEFTDYKWIDPRAIVVAQWVRVKCLFGCPDYGLGACPPNTPSVEDCDKFFKEYHSGVVIRLSHYADKTNYPSEWSQEMTRKLLELERQVFLLGHEKTFLLNQTCCSLCKDCGGDRLHCTDKQSSRPSPEGFAVDVYQSLRNIGWDIQVVSKNPSDIVRIAILLVD